MFNKIRTVLISFSSTRDSEESDHEKPLKDPTQYQQKILTDDMYDFPRSHHIESEATLQRRQHCYNNAAPVPCPEGTVFRYDESPKPGTSTIVSRQNLSNLLALLTKNNDDKICK